MNTLAGRALDYRKVINDFVAKTRELRQYELTSDDWNAIELVYHWLKAFRSATTQMSTTKKSMLSSTQAIFRGLQESLQNSLGGVGHCCAWHVRVPSGLIGSF